MNSGKLVKNNLEASKKPQYRPPAPERFIKYELLSDQSGFRVADTNFVFIFDEFGGWLIY